MRHHLRFLVRIFAASLLLLFGAVIAFAISPRQQAEAQALIDRAEKLSSITLPNADPFVLQLRIDGTPSKMTGTGGLYKLWWAAPDKWREAAEFGDLRQVEVRNEEELWIPPNLPLKLESVFANGNLFPFRGKLLRWNEKIVGLHDHNVNGVKLSCVRVEGARWQRELCFDQGTGLLSRVSAVPKVEGGSQFPGSLTEFAAEYRDYTPINNKMLPREIRELLGGVVVTLIRLEGVSIDPKMKFASYMFAAPEGFKSWPTCDHYDLAAPKTPLGEQNKSFMVNIHEIILSPTGPTDTGKLADGVRVVVDPDGTAQEVNLINPTRQPTKQLISTFTNHKYQPASCDGKPVIGILTIPFPDAVLSPGGRIFPYP